MVETVYPVVLSGGSGSRLWPWSREHHPKQLLSFLGHRTLLQDTLCRLEGALGIAAPLIICNNEYRFLVAEQLREIDQVPRQLILEPVGRNTAPALTLAALTLATGGDPLMLVMPADHLIRDAAVFRDVVLSGVAQAQAGRIVTFGIVPTGPETGYGYVERDPAGRVLAFVEKPPLARAQEYVDSGRYFWNSGLFLMRVSTWLREIKLHRPDIYTGCVKARERGQEDGAFFRVEEAAFAACPSESIDYAVMEKTQEGVLLPLDAGWSDVGAWSSFWEVAPHDAMGNVVQGDVWIKDSRNNVLLAQSRFVAAIGVEDLIVVETADALLVAARSHAQQVKDVVQVLKEQGRPEHQHHRRVHRPWGWYETLDQGPRFQVKRIMVRPGAALSLQLHHKRAEHWVVVQGEASVTRGEAQFILQANESTYIPLGTKHRLENKTAECLEIIEVQSGSYLGEDDIVRFEDTYNRHKARAQD